MLVKVRNPIEACQELSALSAPVAAGVQAISVLNKEGFTDEFIVIGRIGEEQAELRLIDTVSGAGTINLTSPLSFSHVVGAKISIIPYNQYEVSRKASESSAWAVLATTDLEVDEEYSVYDDTGGQTYHFYRIRFFNSDTGQYSSYSATIKGTGYSTRAVKVMIDTILSRTNDDKADFTKRKEVLQDVNYAYQQVINAIMASSSEYFLRSLEIPTESFQHEYTLPPLFREIVDIRNADISFIDPVARTDRYNSRGYELVGRNILYLKDVPQPVSDSTDPATIVSNNAYDESGAWVASLDATNVTTDTDEFKTGTGSVNFDIDVSADAGNVAAITNSTFTAVDLTDFEDNGRIWAWMYIPDITYITSVTLRWGSSASAYWSLAITKDYKDNAFHDGWNLLEFDWSDESVTETSTPDVAAVDYLQFRIAYLSGQPDDEDFRLNNIRIATRWEGNHVYEVRYLSQPAQLVNEMDEIDLPEGNQYLLVDYAVAQILMRKGSRDTLAQQLLRSFEKGLSKFITQSAKRTRKMIGFRPQSYRSYRTYGRDSSRITHSDGTTTPL